MTSLPTSSFFATAQAPASRRIQLWERHNAQSLIALECQPVDRQPFAGVEHVLRDQGARFARVHGSAHRVHRTRSAIEQHPTDAVALYVIGSGRTTMETGGRSRTIRPGEIMICAADQPYTRTFSQGFAELAATIPRSALTSVSPQAALTPVVLSAHAQPASLARMLTRALRTQQPVPIDHSAAVDMVSLLLGSSSTQLSHFAAARAVIDDRLGETELAASDIAGAIGVSVRQLSRIFAAADSSVTQYIMGRRLDWARWTLMHPSSVPLQPISEIAAQCAFRSPAYFSDRFFARFGMSPSQVRKQATACGSSGSLSNIGHLEAGGLRRRLP